MELEQIGTEINKLQPTSSQIDHTAPRISVEKQQALGDVFDRWRLNNGWNPWDDKTQMAAIASWVRTLDRENIPASAYHELYERALQTRAAALQSSRNIPNFGAELLLAEWLGPNGLRAEIRQREIDRGRTLGANAATVCRHCNGSGFRHTSTEPSSPVRRCDHTDEA